MVQVLAVGEVVVGTQQASGANGGVEGALSSPPPPARTVTLALTPAQGSILSLAKNIGALTLSLRNPADRSEEHTSELPSLMLIYYAFFHLKKKRLYDGDIH